MRLLILGGGVFLGAAVLQAALHRGHELTVFNRGRARSVWPDTVEALAGDRSAGLPLFAGRRWDGVVDTCGYVPADVKASASALRESGRYLFVSSISAYATTNQVPVTEGDPLASAGGIAPDDRELAHYGPQKAACETEVTRVFGSRALIVRPGLIVGPGDPTGRFSHWPWRTAEGGEMLVPGTAEEVPLPAGTATPAAGPLQVIDVRDLADWIVHLLEDAHDDGARRGFNATGPAGGERLGWRALIDACRAEAAARGFEPATAVPVPEAVLQDGGVQPWSELPLWLPSSDAAYQGFMRVDVSRACAAGLRTRPLRETVAAVLDEGVATADDARRAGRLTREREAQLIARWRSGR